MADLKEGGTLYNQICTKAGLTQKTRYTRLFFEFLAKQDESEWLINDIPNADALQNIKVRFISDRMGSEDSAKKALKALEKQLKAEEKAESKSIAFFYAKMLDYARKVQNDTIIGAEDLTKLAVHMANANKGKDVSTLYGGKVTDEGSAINKYCKKIYFSRVKLCGIESDMSEKELAKAKSLIPDASSSFLKGTVSNTFQLAKAGIKLEQNLSDPEFAEKQAEIIKNASAAALARYVERVNAEITADITDLLNLSMFTAIPANALKAMTKKIYTAEQALNYIQNAKDPKPDEQAEKELEENIKNITDRVNAVKQEINLKYGKQLEEYNKGIKQITNTLNQSGMWYVNEISKYEMQAERTTLNFIHSQFVNMQNQKFEFADEAVESLTEYLVKPVNETIIKAQQAILNEIVHLKYKAINKAKALAAQAIMIILGKLGV